MLAGKTLSSCVTHMHTLNLTNNCQAVSARNKVLWLGKWRPKPIHAATSPGIELRQPRPEQWLTDTAWSVLGVFREHPHSSFSSPPSLPQKHIYRFWLLGVNWKNQCFEKTCRCWNRSRSKTMWWRECVNHRSLLSLVPYDQVKHALRCTSRPVDFSSYLCCSNEGYARSPAHKQVSMWD